MFRFIMFNYKYDCGGMSGASNDASTRVSLGVIIYDREFDDAV